MIANESDDRSAPDSGGPTDVDHRFTRCAMIEPIPKPMLEGPDERAQRRAVGKCCPGAHAPGQAAGDVFHLLFVRCLHDVDRHRRAQHRSIPRLEKFCGNSETRRAIGLDSVKKDERAAACLLTGSFGRTSLSLVEGAASAAAHRRIRMPRKRI